MENYKKNSLSLKGAVALGTGVMIGAGIFALLGQVAELSGSWFPYVFLLGAIFYLIMDMIVHWGILKHLKKEVRAKSGIVLTSLILDLIILTGFIWIKAGTDVFVLAVSAAMITLVFAVERWFLYKQIKYKSVKNGKNNI